MPIPEPKADEPEDEFMSRCMSAIGDEYPQDQAIAICMSQWRGEKMMEAMHPDFKKIHSEFTKYYCKKSVPCEQGDFEFNAWVNDLKLNTSKSYGMSQEAFVWAKDMISKFKEDETNVYYKVLFAFPIESMNYNVYTEEEIKASVKTILVNKEGSPSLNHWEDTRKQFQKGGVKYVAAEYEDGACEAILQVPKTFVCPMCGKGKTLTSLIDNKEIVNVSLEATCKLGTGPDGACIGLEFDPPTLLTSDTLPGIPLARIFPLEKLMREAVGRTRKGRKKMEIKVVGLEQEEPPAKKPPVVMPDDNMQCPDGYIYNSELGYCVPVAPEAFDCPEGQHWDDEAKKCVPDLVHEPEGTVVALGTPASGDSSKKPVEQGIPQTGTSPAPAAEPSCPDGQIWDDVLKRCVTPGAAPATEAALELKLSDLELRNFQTEQKFKSAEEQIAYLNNKDKQNIVDKMNLQAQLKAAQAECTRLQSTVDKRDLAIIEKDKAYARIEIEKEKQAKEYMENLEKATEHADVTSTSRDQYKTQLEELRASYSELDTKYTELMDASLTQTKKLTTANERLLEAEGEISDLRQQIKRAKRQAKVIVSMGE